MVHLRHHSSQHACSMKLTVTHQSLWRWLQVKPGASTGGTRHSCIIKVLMAINQKRNVLNICKNLFSRKAEFTPGLTELSTKIIKNRNIQFIWSKPTLSLGRKLSDQKTQNFLASPFFMYLDLNTNGFNICTKVLSTLFILFSFYLHGHNLVFYPTV